MFRKVIVILILVLLWVYSGPAQTPHFKNHKLFPKKKTYLANVIHQDRTGYIWFGTSEGLVRYDGTSYSVYTVNDSLAENHVTSIAEDNLGKLWIGHKKGGISIYSNQLFEKFDPEEGLGLKMITRLFIDRDNLLWFSTNGEGVYFYKNNRLYNLNTDDGLADDYAYCFAQDDEGKIWIGTDLGISIYNPADDHFSSLSSKDGLPDNLVKHLVYDPDSNVMWIGMADLGIVTYDIDTQQFSTPFEWQYGSLDHFTFSTNRELWSGTETGGIIRVTLKEEGKPDIDQFTTQHGLINNKTYDIFNDRESNIWIGCFNGVTQTTGNLFEFLSSGDNLPGISINAFLIDQSKNYWICTENGLFVSKNNGSMGITFERFFKDPSFDPVIFTSLYEDSSGKIWTGTYGFGAYKIDPGTGIYASITSQNGLTNNNIISITGRGETVILSTLGGGISIYDPAHSGGFRNITTEEGLGSNYVYACYIDHEKRIWVAQSGSGVSVIEKSGITTFDEESGMKSRDVLNMLEDRNGNMWFITPGQGMFQYNQKEFIPFNISNGLLSNDIRSITIDDFNRLVFTSEEGITSYNTETMQFANYGTEIGVVSFDPKENSIFKDNQGSIWIGLNDMGLIKYNPEDTAKGATPPLIKIIRKQVYENDIPENKSVFRYNEKNFTFNWIGFWFRAPEQLRYRYKLDGHDLDWSVPSSALTTTYSSMQPGYYTFHVEVALEDGKWISAKDASFHFRIKPPFWLRWWFFIISGFAIVSLVIFYIKRREYNLIREKNILEERVKERTAEVVSQKEEIEMQRDEIEAQRDLVTQQKDVIELKNKNITDSILYASRIQTAVLPPCEQLDELLLNHFIINKPKDIVSGDFYWLARLNEKLIFTVADCTGHGVPGAFMSMLGMTLLDEIVKRDGIHKANTILDQLRNRIKIALRQTGKDEEAKDGMDIALCVYDQKSKTLQYSGAFNPLYHIRKDVINVFKADRMPIGIHLKEEKSFSLHEIEIREGDLVYLFSDGYADQFGGDMNKKFSSRRFHELLFSIRDKSMKEQQKILEENLVQWKGDEPQVDDIIILGVRL